jgi:enoyl-CoA hydratase/carnithine racemase
MIDAPTALSIGLVNRVVPHDKLMDEVMELANKIKSKSMPIIAQAKKAMNNGINTDLTAGLNCEAECICRCFATEDKTEGLKAFIEKRPPEFKHK